jgi:hypothetical protein
MRRRLIPGEHAEKGSLTTVDRVAASTKPTGAIGSLAMLETKLKSRALT